MNMWRIIDRLLGRPVCQLCGAVGLGPDICSGCFRDLPWNRQACPVCARPVATPGLCAPCVSRQPAFERAQAPLVYAFPVDRLLQRLKYGRYLPHARLLGELTGHRLRRLAERPAAIVPVPLHWRRFRSRGFNQASEIASIVARVTRVPLRDICRRRKNTPPLWSLPPPERRRQVAGAFECRHAPPKHVAVLDDVLTTGATAEALAVTLLRHGARRVDVWAVARSPGRLGQPQALRNV